MYIKAIILFIYIIVLLHYTDGSICERIENAFNSLPKLKIGFGCCQKDRENKVGSRTSGMKGFKNPNVACYANSLIQSLLNINVVRDRGLDSESPNCHLKQVFRDYMDHSKENLNLTDLRSQYYDKKSLKIQQDPSEFFLRLLSDDNTKYLQDLCSYDTVRERECGCPQRKDIVKDFTFRLNIPHKDMFHPATIDNLITMNMEDSLDTMPRCLDCRKPLHTRTSFENFHQILIFVLQLGEQGANSVELHKITDFKLDGVANGGIEVGKEKKAYELSAGIFHHGKNLKSGHYTAIVKKGGRFFKADDKTIKECDWPDKSKELYMLFYVEKPSM